MTNEFDKYLEYIPENLREQFQAEIKKAIELDPILTAVNALNEMIEADPVTVNHLVTDMLQCGPALVPTKAELIQLGPNKFCLGLMGIINGVLSNPDYKIVPVFADINKMPRLPTGAILSLPVSAFNVRKVNHSEKVDHGQ